MNSQGNKLKTGKKYLIFGISALFLTFLQTQVAAALSCDDVQNNTDEAKKYIITIVEEPIGSTPESGEQVVQCYRQTTLTPAFDASGNPTNQPASSTSIITGTCTYDEKNGVTCQKIQVYYAASGADLLFTYISRVYKWAAGTVGIITVLYLVWGGIEIAASQGDTGKMEKAKAKIIQSIGGLVLLFLSALILYTINPNFFTV